MFPATPPRWMTRSSTRKLTEIFCRCSGSSPSENLPGNRMRWSVAIDPVTAMVTKLSPFNSLTCLDNVTEPHGPASARQLALTCLPWLVRIRPNTAPDRSALHPRIPVPLSRIRTIPLRHRFIRACFRRRFRIRNAAGGAASSLRYSAIAVMAAAVVTTVLVMPLRRRFGGPRDADDGVGTDARSRTIWTRCSAATSRRSPATRCAGCSTRSRRRSRTWPWPI